MSLTPRSCQGRRRRAPPDPGAGPNCGFPQRNGWCSPWADAAPPPSVVPVMINTAIAGVLLAVSGTFPALDGWVGQGWASGALLTAETSTGTRADAAGEASVGGYFRIGSATKTFV